MENYTIENIDELDSPSLVVFPEIVKYNIETAVKIIGDKTRLRPHIKTHKTAEVIEMCQQAGIQKYKCATIAEAELLAITNAKDVLLAYQPVANKIKRFLNLNADYPNTRFSCLVDSTLIAYQINNKAIEKGIVVDLFIDINTGMNRTGIEVNLALDLAKLIIKKQGLNLRGLHCYDGNIRDVNFEERVKNCEISFQKVKFLEKELANISTKKMALIMGGSPTFPIHAQRNDVECSPGTFVFWDKGYTESCPEQDFKPAVLVISRVISLPSPTSICLDLGHKSVAAENPLQNRVYFINSPAMRFISQSEEHLIVETEANHSYQIGDVFYGIPIHICPTVALYETMFVVENNRLTNDTWQVRARQRKINI